MNIKIKILVGFIAIILLLCLGLVLTGNAHIFRAVQLTYLKGNDTANINDGQDFETRIIRAGKPQPWALHENYNKQPLNADLEKFLTSTNSVAYLIIKDGKLHSEFYFEPYHDRSRTNSFSMAKSILTMMVGAAIDDGFIKSFDEPVSNYIPEFKGKEVTLAQLSAMSSGVDWEEDYYSPFSPTPKLLYGYDVETYSLSREYPKKPGSEYYYASVSTQVLGIALQRALKKAGKDISVSEYLSEKFWQPMGMEDDATWHTDAEGMELVYCCINSNARNFAKFGLLLSQQGAWNTGGLEGGAVEENRDAEIPADKISAEVITTEKSTGERLQLLKPEYVEHMIKPDLVSFYGHSIWTDDRENPIFYLMMGHLGQYVVVVPEHNMIVVRLGEFRDADADHITFFIPKEVAYYVDEAIKRVHSEDANQ